MCKECSASKTSTLTPLPYPAQSITSRILDEMDTAERNAWDALSRYKFQMFGYWAAIWVHLNRLGQAQHPNPFSEAVKLAQGKRTR
jgi:hypothetical protein